MKRILIGVLAAVSVITPPASRNARGSLVVAIVGSKGDYIVIAAESRNTNGWDHTPANDDACKIISVGGETLFFETGESEYRSHQGSLWDSRAIARAVYSKSKDYSVHALSLAWIDEARKWFAQLSDTEMRSVIGAWDGDVGKIGTGGFAGFGADGVPSVESEKLLYSFADRRFDHQPEFAPVGPGQGGASGAALDLVDEFFKMQSPRALLARGFDSPSLDSAQDSRIAANAIQFAETYSTGQERSRLGGPVDIAVLRKNTPVKWVSRKDECYRYDLKASRTIQPKRQQK